MKSVISSLVSAAATAGLIVAAGVGSVAASELAPEHEFLKELFPQTEISAVNDAPFAGFYEMKVGADVFYVSKDGSFLIQGEVYDIETKLNLTESSKANTRKAYASRFNDEQSIVFPAENPIGEVVVFTDIDCGYCRKLHREMANYHEKGISIRYVFFPRSGPGSSSWQKAEAVWCAESQAAAMTQAKNNEEVQSEPCDASIIDEHYAVVNELGLSGTPALLTERGDLIIGYRSAEELIKIINLEI